MRDARWRAPTSALAVDSDLSDGERDKPSKGGDEGKGGLHCLENQSSSCVFNRYEIYVFVPWAGQQCAPDRRLEVGL